ncbi:MAG: MBL fold metallo-hydrolase [Actinomycetota bacterium]|nr:MBL fold metallo-hydrolase [Actinomycetota bacterium]
MKIQVLYDKEAVRKGLHSGWGVSFLINDEILFDTGENGGRLLDNMKKLNVDIGKISSVVLSHDHWDHTGGLWHLLKRREGLKIYSCPCFSPEFKKRVKKLKGRIIESDGIKEIKKNIFVTGEIAGEYKGSYMGEQSLVMKTGRGLIIATGCSHPGIIKIIKQVIMDFPGMKIYLVFGGFHLLHKSEEEIRPIAEEFKELGIEKAGPTHCTGDQAQMIFREVYKDNYVHIKVGLTLEV